MKKLLSMSILKKLCVLSALLLAVSMSANAQSDGSLDTSFNHTGKVTTSISSSDAAYGIAIQNDQKIVVVGSAFLTDESFAVTRYNANGTLDNTFGTGGKTTTDLGPDDFGSQAQGVVIQADGKIVAAGNSAGGDGFFTLIRYNTNGIIDSTFGNSGIEGSPVNGVGYAVALQADQKIVAAGSYNGGFGVARYNSDGSPDNTFGTGGVFPGVVSTTIGTGFQNAFAVSIQSNGKIVTAGTSQNGANSEFTLVRYNTDGSIDSSFGTAGIVTTIIGTTSSAYGLSIQSDGKIIAAGSSGSGAGAVFALARYDTTGSLDDTFGNGGTLKTTVGSGGGYAQSVSIQSDGNVIAAGFAGADFALVRYTANGTLDATFGTGGKVTTPFGNGGNTARGNCAALQANGKIVVAGDYEVNSNDYQFALARYNNTDTILGIVDYDSEAPVHIYPNPATSQLTIHPVGWSSNGANTSFFHNEAVTVSVMNMLGQMSLFPTTLQMSGENAVIDVSKLAAGMYFLEMKSENASAVRRFVKE